MKVEEFNIYPIKSTKGIPMDEVIVEKFGFKNDRHFAIINSSNQVITARENATLLKIKTEIDKDNITIIYQNEAKSTSLYKNLRNIQVSIFKNKVNAKLIDSNINNWISEILNQDSKLIKIDLNNLPKTNNYKVSFSDLYPVHLVSQESINALNRNLDSPIENSRFRPNIIVSDIKAFEEENWEKLIIGNCEFEVVDKTQRCSLITINPENGVRSKQQEPLRTLAKDFKYNGKTNFGIYLVPITTGKIKKSDKLKVIRKT